jgi:hypothetical protein
VSDATQIFDGDFDEVVRGTIYDTEEGKSFSFDLCAKGHRFDVDFRTLADEMFRYAVEKCAPF